MSKKQNTPRARRTSRMEPDAPEAEAVERVKAVGKKIPRRARAESDAKAERAEGEQTGNGLVAVVGVGASAGGLEAFKQLLARLPADTGMAFALVTHLDPKHESILPELLAKATRMPVSEAEDGAPAAPDHVYVIPRNKGMAIEGGALRLRPREEGRVLRHPIDDFLQTLAEDQSTRAIGVILSGTATDGTLGLEAVKAEGGITFAQEPKSAKYDSMPRSAIAAGCVDFVLTPEGSPKSSRASAAILTSLPPKSPNPAQKRRGAPQARTASIKSWRCFDGRRASTSVYTKPTRCDAASGAA